MPTRPIHIPIILTDLISHFRRQSPPASWYYHWVDSDGNSHRWRADWCAAAYRPASIRLDSSVTIWMEWIIQGIPQSCISHSTHLRQIAAVLKISLGLIYGIFTLRRLRAQKASQLRQTLVCVPGPILHNLIVFAYVAHIGDQMQTLTDLLIQHRSYGGYILFQHLQAMRFQLLIETFHAGAQTLLQLLLAAWAFL